MTKKELFGRGGIIGELQSVLLLLEHAASFAHGSLEVELQAALQHTAVGVQLLLESVEPELKEGE